MYHNTGISIINCTKKRNISKMRIIFWVSFRIITKKAMKFFTIYRYIKATQMKFATWKTYKCERGSIVSGLGEFGMSVL